MNFLETELYERDGKAITNFEKLLPGVGTDLANELTFPTDSARQETDGTL